MNKLKVLTLIACLLLSGCFSEIEDAPETGETAQEQTTSATTTQVEAAAVATVPEPQPTMFCDYNADRVEHPEYAELIADIDSFFVQEDFQGAVLVAKGEELIYVAGYGSADIMTERMCTARDTFELGSLSKQMTAVAILQLMEQGRLSLDDTIDKYFPEYEHGKNITIRNLLQMRSGLYDFLNNAGSFFPKDFYEEFLERADAPDESTPDFPRDFLLEYLYRAPLESDPDECFSYSNTNYYLLGLIIEQVSGMTYQDYLQSEIFDPCGMRTANNGFRDTTTRGYYHDGTTLSMRTSTALGCGSVNGSVYDMYQWYMNLFDYELISRQTLIEMLTPVDGYGYGIRYDDGFAYHLGNTDVFNAYAAVYVQHEFLVITLTNSSKYERIAGGYAAHVLDIYFNDDD